MTKPHLEQSIFGGQHDGAHDGAHDATATAVRWRVSRGTAPAPRRGRAPGRRGVVTAAGAASSSSPW